MVVVYVGLCWFIVVLYWFMASIMYCRAYEWKCLYLLLVVWFILMGQKFCFGGKSLLSGDIQNAGRVFQRSHWGLPSSNDSTSPCFYTTEIRPSRVELATSGNPYPTSKSSRAGRGWSFLYWDFSKCPSIWSIVKYYWMPHSSLQDGKI